MGKCYRNAMKRWLACWLSFAVLLLLAGCMPAADAPAQSKVFTDMAGRRVEVPTGVTRAFGTDPVGTITLYTLAPDKLIGWNYKLNEEEKALIASQYTGLPVYGMRDTFNAEALIEAQAQLVIQMGATNASAAEQADGLQQKLGIPVAVLSGKLPDLPEAYRLLGEMLGETERAKTLADYCRTALERVINIPDGEKVTVYYGNGVNSLETAPQGSDAAEVIELAGGYNVAALSVENPSERISISPEQVIAWNPAFVFINGEPKEGLSGASAAQAFAQDTKYATLEAVQRQQVYSIPKSPFSWLDRPKAANRVIGLLWAGWVMYPEKYADVDMAAEAKTFYQLFYHTGLSDEQAKNMIQAGR